jgi:hypothetical protein
LIEPKYRSKRRVSNIAHIMLTTNAAWAVPAGSNARRFLVLDVSQDRVNDHAYFKDLWHQIDNGGTEAFFNLLLSTPLTNLRVIPRTNALREQQLLSAKTMVRWAADAVAAGELILQIGSIPRPGGGFNSKQPAKTLYAAYMNWCVGMRERPVTMNTFSKWLSRCGFPHTTIKGIVQYAIPDARAFGVAVLQDARII